MNALLSRAGALFVAPATAATEATPAVAPSRAELVGVLAPAEVLMAVAGGVAGALRHARRARAALLLVSGDVPEPGPSLPAARALARRLVARELAATAAGTVARVALPADAEAAARVAWQAVAAAAGAPAVIALAGRSDGYDALLAHADELVLAAPGDDAALAELALASLSALGPAPRLVAPPAGVFGRRLAALGFARLRPVAAEVHA